MAKFEVFIPPADPAGFNVTFRVDATNWMAALRIGLMKLGQQGASAQNILVDIQDDNSVHITESDSGRVFRIRELNDQEVAQTKQKAGTEALVLDDRADTPKDMPAVEAPAKPAAPGLGSANDRPTLVNPVVSLPPSRPTPAKPEPAPPVSPAASPPPKAAAPARPRKQAPQEARAISRALTPHQVIELESPAKPVQGSIGRNKSSKEKKAELEDVLADVFERVQEVYTTRGTDEALYFLLDLALEKINAESGSVFKSDGATGALSFWAARGPKASELLSAKIVVPAGNGIVGFCAAEGVSVALSDVQKDPRYYSAVSDRVKYETRSVLCSPMMTHGRTFGAMQIINKKNGAVFQEYEVGLLSYIAHQGALYLNNAP